MITPLKEEHARVTRTLGYVLTLGSRDAWWGLRTVLVARLALTERAALAFVALKTLPRDTAEETAEAVLFDGAGQPHAPLFGFMNQAAFWADFAEPKELEAYCLASFNAMPRGRQKAFLEYAQPGVAA